MVNKIYDEYTDRHEMSPGLKHYWRNRKRQLATKHSFKIRSPEMHILNGARSRAKERGIDFNLEIEDVQIPDVCPICKIPIKFSEKRTDNTPSIDRLDNDLGYIKGNVRIISWRANRLKNNMTKEEVANLYGYLFT